MTVTAMSSAMLPEMMMKGMSSPVVFKKLERRHAAEAGQRIVGDHQIPRLACQGRRHGRGSFHPFEADLVAGAAQLAESQQRVVLGVFDNQKTER